MALLVPTSLYKSPDLPFISIFQGFHVVWVKNCPYHFLQTTHAWAICGLLKEAVSQKFTLQITEF